MAAQPVQVGLFTSKEDIARLQEPREERPIGVRLGNHFAPVRLGVRRKQAFEKLKALLPQWEGRDLLLGSYWGAHNHFWADGLRLSRAKFQLFGYNVLVFWGTRGQQIRLFLDQLYDVRENDYGDYKQWLIDFWNGFGENPINKYRPQGYVSLQVRLANGKVRS